MTEPGRVEAYASAILAVARAEGVLDRVSDELFRFARAFEQNDALRQALTDASVPTDARQGFVEDLLGPKALPLSTAFVSFVVGAGRARDLVNIADRLIQVAAAERKHEVAEVRSSVPLDADQQDRLARALSAALRCQVEVKVIVDPSVLGGVVARVGDTVIDGSVRHRLEKLREVL